VSTFTSYLLLSRDLPLTMSNLSKTRPVSNAAQYYQTNIGKVKSVDDLLGDQRLFSYVMKAAGLEDMTYAKAFIKKVLLSDLNDKTSFANQLTDKRYYDLAKSFNFNTSGALLPVTDIQSDLQQQTMVGLYSSSILARENAASQLIAEYSAGIDALTSVDGLLDPGNKKLFDFALTAHSLGSLAKYASTGYFRDILTHDLGDTGHPIYAVSDTALREKLLAFVSAFNFADSDTVPAGTAQSTTQKSATIDGYLKNSGASTATATLLYSAQTYRDAIGAITSAQDLVDNPAVLNVALTAYGLDPAAVDDADVLAALTSDLSDPQSAANTLGLGYRRLAEAFNFEPDGTITSGQPVQSPQAVERTVSGYLANANRAALPNPNEFDLYKRAINKPGLIENVDDFLMLMSGVTPNPLDDLVNDNAAKQMANFVLRSFGFDVNTRLSGDFLRDVLTSDLDDPASFANTQEDKRWAALAGMFNFQADGSLPPDGIVQDVGKIHEMLERYVGKGFGGAPISSQATYAYRFDMKYVANVDDFLDDTSSFSFALVAFGFDRVSASKDYFRRLLTDSAFAASEATARSDPRLTDFAAAFSFQADGSLPAGQPAQTKANEDLMVERFLAQSDSSTGAYSLRLASEYKAAVLNIRSASDFVKPENDSVYKFALAAFGIDAAAVAKDQIVAVLTSDPDDPNSTAARLGGGFQALAEAFNFHDGRGIVPTGTLTQTMAQLDLTVANYLARNNPAAVAQTSAATANFTSAIASLEARAALSGTRAVDEFLADARLYDYAMIAYGLDPKTTPKDAVRQALISDKSDRNSFVNRPGNEKYKALADALNFDPDGSVGTPRQAQTPSDALRIAQRYAASYPPSTRPAYAPDRPTDQENQIKAQSDYYASAILRVATADQLVADTRLVGYITKAFGLPANFSTSDLKRILVSDLADPKSFANGSKNLVYREMAASFNFATDGQTRRLPELAAQSSGGIYETHANYLLQTLETNEGQSNPGVRLALYFKRKAPTIMSAYSLLGDKALFEVARTALGIPLAAARADIDVLARTIEKKFNVADLKDPTKLDKFIKRFTAMYDIDNGGGVQNSNNIALGLITGTTAANGFSQETLASLQSMRFRQF
jgi:hypothetical protein